ncbi:PAS domain-containing protein [Stenotrophomonas rhizophila]|uniref:histidine kinase n=2 Tax=Stenotrophomonas rhizophila TaxID=216778 RepID=A0A498CMM9_9GAMM|nr:PAS domain-containing protein [Stenotrophomonas rhizophila]
MADMIRSHDWADTPMGPAETWPHSLRTSLGFVLNSTLLGAVLWGPELRLFYSDGYREMLGDRHPGALGQPVVDVWGETYAPIAESFATVMATGQGFGSRDIRLPMVRDGVQKTTHWNATASPIFGEDGSIMGILNIAIEITDQVKANAERDEQHLALNSENKALSDSVDVRIAERDSDVSKEQAFEQDAERGQLALAAGAIVGTWSWDLTQDRFTIDEAFSKSFGLEDLSRLSGIPLARIVANVHPDDLDGLAAAISEVIARGGAYAHQYRVRQCDGEYHWVEANGRVEHAPDGTPLRFPGVILDVGEKRELVEQRDNAWNDLRQLNAALEDRITERTQELMQSEEALRQSQKMEAVGHLTGGLAHDFNNLLAGILGALDLIALRLEQGRTKDLEKYVTTAQGAAGRAAALTHRLLAFARRQTLLPEPTSVNRLVIDMLGMIQRTVGPGIRIENVAAAGLWPALVDRSQLENSLLSLCINARDAMPTGGRLTIETCNRWIDPGMGKQLNMPEGEYLSMCVSDTGAGMPPEVIAKAFDPFFTTKPLGAGTGLGLSMIYGFAKQSGGQVRIHSEVGEGSMVCIYLPRHHEAGVEADKSVAPLKLVPTNAGETVMIVDDEPSIRMLLTDVLEEMSYHVIQAADSQTGLKILQSDVRLDLLISDVGLPGGMNGRQMADAARVTRPNLKVLFVTGFAESAMLNEGHLSPGMTVMTKPFNIGILTERVRDLISL